MFCISAWRRSREKCEKTSRIADRFSGDRFVNYLHYFLLPPSNTFHLVDRRLRFVIPAVRIRQPSRRNFPKEATLGPLRVVPVPCSIGFGGSYDRRNVD